MSPQEPGLQHVPKPHFYLENTVVTVYIDCAPTAGRLSHIRWRKGHCMSLGPGAMWHGGCGVHYIPIKRSLVPGCRAAAPGPSREKKRHDLIV